MNGFDYARLRRIEQQADEIVTRMEEWKASRAAREAADARSHTDPLPTPTSPTQPPPADLGLIPLTVVEIKKLFNLASRLWRSTSHYLHWPWWRRRHQARARWYHYRARLT